MFVAVPILLAFIRSNIILNFQNKRIIGNDYQGPYFKNQIRINQNNKGRLYIWSAAVYFCFFVEGFFLTEMLSDDPLEETEKNNLKMILMFLNGFHQ